jgi:hypothetical protein
LAASGHASNTGKNRTVLHPCHLSNHSYSAEEIRFNLLAIAQRSYPILMSQLAELRTLYDTVLSHLEKCNPNWRDFLDSAPPLSSKVDADLVNKTIKRGELLDLISLKKALDRDISLVKSRVVDEEEKLSGYTVSL